MQDKDKKIEAYGNIISAWYILAGIEPLEEYCEEQVKKLINLHPEDEKIIREEYRKVFGDD